jgi:hypothetical protein
MGQIKRQLADNKISAEGERRTKLIGYVCCAYKYALYIPIHIPIIYYLFIFI